MPTPEADLSRAAALLGTPADAPEGRRAPWAWAAVALAMMALALGYRLAQDRRLGLAARPAEVAPFPLKSLPYALGDWKAPVGVEEKLDDQIARLAGTTDYIVRTYSDELTGVSLTVLVIFGPSEAVYGHTPQVCYPSTGYVEAEAAALRAVPPGAAFRSAVFSRDSGGAVERQEVHHAFRHEGGWSPEANRRRFNKVPDMFKVQVARRVAPGERRDRDNPSEQFLALLVAEIDRRLAAAPAPPASAR